mgnify:CR=1 FL=1
MFQVADSSARMADKIYRIHSGFVWRIARARGIPIASIPDILQEVFVTVLRRLSTYQEMDAIKGWLYTIADGHIRQYFRSEGRRVRRMSLLAQSDCGRPTADDLDAHLSRSEASRLVQLFIDGLSSDLREVFLLCCVEGLPGVEVAALVGLNVNTLYSRVATARQRFAAFVQQVQACEQVTP